jgi:hypothetical protein
MRCMLIALVGNIISSPCLAQPVDLNTTVSINSKLTSLKASTKPLIPRKDNTVSDLEAPITNVVEEHPKPDSSDEKIRQQPDADADKNNQEFPDRRGFFTGHRIPLELFGEETLRHIELIEEAKEKNSEALERVPPGYPRRIPLELFSKESLRRIDGLDTDENKESANFPRRIPLELFNEESLERLGLLDEKKEHENVEETSKLPLALNKERLYVNSDLLRSSEDVLEELRRSPRLAIHGGISDDPEAAAHHFPALTIGGEGDPAFLDTLLSYYN